ncbi:MAG: RNase adapter RapZ [Rhodobacteraceae bacterium]|nr:RNase adapter RapZ [Paracoccaceae bacterium]
MSDSEPEQPPLSRVIVVTGPSGAGRSTAVRALEDMGAETIDNLPLSLVPRLLDGPPLNRPLVLGMDARNRDFTPAALLETLDRLVGAPEIEIDLLYLDSRVDVLVRRYSETRRRHPMAPAESPMRGIERELELLGPIRARADFLIDTSELTPHELKSELAAWFGGGSGRGGAAGLAVSVHSFSYKRGVPRGIDTVFDCRFLANPYWVPDLREKDGRDPSVARHIAADPKFEPFFYKVKDLATFLLPAHVDEGKAHFAIGFGCTGGQHRSVMLAERLGDALRSDGWTVSVRHRELDRRGATTDAPNRRESAA